MGDKYYNKFVSDYMDSTCNLNYSSINDTTINNLLNSASSESEILNKNSDILFQKESGGILNTKYGIYSNYLRFLSDTNCDESINSALNTPNGEKDDFKKYIHTLNNNEISRLTVNSCNNIRKVFFPGIVTDINKRIVFAVVIVIGLFLNFIILPFISGRINFSEQGVLTSYAMQLIINIFNNGIFISEHFSVLVCGCIDILAILYCISLYFKNIFIKKTYHINTQLAKEIYNFFIKSFIKSSIVYAIYFIVITFMILSLNYTTIYNALSGVSKFTSQFIGYDISNNTVLCIIMLVIQLVLYAILFSIFATTYIVLDIKSSITLQDVFNLYKLNTNSTSTGGVDDEG